MSSYLARSTLKFTARVCVCVCVVSVVQWTCNNCIRLRRKCRKWGRAPPAPNVDWNRPGPARDHVHGTARDGNGRCAESLEALPAPTHTHTQDRYPALRGD